MKTTITILILSTLWSCRVGPEEQSCTKDEHSFQKWEEASSEGFFDGILVQERSCEHCGWTERRANSAK